MAETEQHPDVHMEFDQDALVMVELVRFAREMVVGSICDGRFGEAEADLVADSKAFLRAWIRRKMPVLEMPSLK